MMMVILIVMMVMTEGIREDTVYVTLGNMDVLVWRIRFQNK